MSFPLIFEDQDVLVINKPPGVVSNAADTTKVSSTVQAWMAERLAAKRAVSRTIWQTQVPADFNLEFGTPEEIFGLRQGIVHRLDKDTSGVMILAKHPGSLVNLLSQFKQRQTAKKYLALVHGKLVVPAATISEPIGRASRDRKLFAVRVDGREAVTRYQVINTFDQVDVAKIADRTTIKLAELTRRFYTYQGFSLVECWPQTGRTHQIRVHLTHLRHPIVGDMTYLGRKRQQLDPIWCPRQFLHAVELKVLHPRSGEEMVFKAELSQDLQEVLNILR